MLKFLTAESKSVTGAALLISAASLLSRVIGLARDRVFAHYFGVGPVMDAYYAAFKFPDLVYNLLIVGALTAGFIPIFTKLFYESADKSAAWRLVNNVLNILGVILASCAVLGVIFAPILTKLIAPGFTGETRTLVVAFTRIMFLSPLCLGISMVLGGVLQSLRQFTLYAIAPLFYNLGIIIGVTVLTRTALGLTGLAWGVVLGAMLHALVQMAGASGSGWRWQWQFSPSDPATRRVGRLMVPRTLGLAMSQLNWFIITMLASILPAGSVAVYNFAHNLQNVPTGLIGVAFALATFPVLARLHTRSDHIKFRRQLAATTRQILFLIIPCAVAILLLRAQIVRVVLGSGAFDWTATRATANTLAFFALGLWAQSLIPLLARAFYALNNTVLPFVIGGVAELLSIGAALMLMRPWGVAGLALASTVGATVNALLLAVYVRKVTGGLEEGPLMRLLGIVAVAALGMALTIQFLKYPLASLLDLDRFWGVLLQGAVAGVGGFLTYGIICRLLHLEEMLHLQQSLKRRWLKFRQVPPGIDEAEQL